MANIKLNNNEYPIPDSALAAPTADFIAHLGTITGSGLKVTVGGVEYGIDSSKVAGAVSALDAAFAELENGGEERLEGTGSEYYTLAPTALSFRSTEPLAEFQEVQVNGQTIDPANYTLEEGSTIVKLSIDYLKTLDKGNYEVAVVSENKTVSGNFTVAAPELNEHGFYYNQPYSAYVEYFGTTLAIFIRDNGTLDTIFADGRTDICTYTVDGNNMVVTSATLGELHCAISNHGAEIYNAELNTTFTLDNEAIVADKDYLYFYKEDFGGYEVTAIDKTKASYAAIKTGLYGHPIVALAEGMFADGINEIFNENMIVAPNIPETVTTIGAGAFGYCAKLIEITIPDSVIEIGESAFYRCSNLTNVTIGNSVTSIGDDAFVGCIKLAEVYNRSNLNIVKDSNDYGSVAYHALNVYTPTVGKRKVFETDDGFVLCEDEDICYLLGYKGDKTDILLPESCNGKNYELYEYAFSDYTNLTSVKISDNVTAIRTQAFWNCSNITKIEIGDGVTIIYTCAFEDCSNLSSVIIPDSVTTIGVSAFADCSNLTSITFDGTMEQWNSISKGFGWNANAPATYVQCSDGQATL